MCISDSSALGPATVEPADPAGRSADDPEALVPADLAQGRPPVGAAVEVAPGLVEIAPGLLLDGLAAGGQPLVLRPGLDQLPTLRGEVRGGLAAGGAVGVGLLQRQVPAEPGLGAVPEQRRLLCRRRGQAEPGHPPESLGRARQSGGPGIPPRPERRDFQPGLSVRRSWGRHTAAVRAACSGPCSASQRSLVTVNDARGTEPTASAQARGPPNSATSSAAAPAERVSFHSRAGRTTSPCSSRHTMPCCCAPTATATTSAIPPASASAVHQLAGSTSVPSGCSPRPWRSSAPVSASRMTTLQNCVEESIPATSAIAVHLRVGPVSY